jgi:hypothetical protein
MIILPSFPELGASGCKSDILLLGVAQNAAFDLHKNLFE